MDSFLSGSAHSYGGAQIGQGYTGSVGAPGAVSPNAGQSIDVSQLQPGDTFQGEIVSVNGEDVQLQLTNGQYMLAKLERDVQVAIGQILNLQVQSNRDNRIVLRPVYDGRAQMLRVGEAALRAAHMAVSDKNLALVSKLIENGQSIDKNTLMNFNRLSFQNPNADLADIIKLTKLQLPVDDHTLTQLSRYQNMEHKLLDGIREASDELLKLYDALAQGRGSTESRPAQAGQGAGAQGQPGMEQGAASMQGAASGQSAALESGGRLLEQVLALLSGEESPADGGGQPIQPGAPSVTDMGGGPQEQPVAGDGSGQKSAGAVPDPEAGREDVIKNAAQDTVTQKASDAAAKAASQDDRQTGTVLDQLRSERRDQLPDKIISYIRDGKLGIKEMRQLLADSALGGRMTVEQKAAVFRSGPFRTMLKNGLQRQWTLTPQELAQDGKVEEFYQKLMRESSQLSRMMDEAMQAGGQNMNGAQARAMGNIRENVEFMNHMNQMFDYIQLPLKLSDSQAHGDLYVYTNKKNLARREGLLTAFLHLDMDHLGALDISIALQSDKGQVTTKFYLDEDVISLVEGHMDELTRRLAKKGYQCRSLVLEKEEDKTVIEHIEEQIAGGSAVLSYQTFDSRA